MMNDVTDILDVICALIESLTNKVRNMIGRICIITGALSIDHIESAINSNTKILTDIEFKLDKLIYQREAYDMPNSPSCISLSNSEDGLLDP